MKLYEFGPTRAARCLWTLNELGVTFERIEVDLSAGAHRQPEFLALNPMGRIPVLVCDGLILTESFAICTWLADRYPGKGLIPAPGSPDRAVHDRWMFFCATELDAPLWRIRRNKILLPDAEQVRADIPNARADFLLAARVLQDELAGREFVVGGRFSVADIVLAHTLFWSTWNDLLAELPGLAAYMERHLRRPACPEALRPD